MSQVIPIASSLSPPAARPCGVLTVVFCGTDGTMAVPRGQIEVFATQLINAHLLNPPPAPPDADVAPLEPIRGAVPGPVADDLNPQYLLRFDGVGKAFGVPGILFGAGLGTQVDQALDHIRALLAKLRPAVPSLAAADGASTTVSEPPRGPLTINAVGLSRGACACLLLCQRLAAWPDAVTVNLFLYDPVPGNNIGCAWWNGCTLAARALDVSDSPVLRRVHAIYPHEPLPDYLFHAPLFPSYPAQCRVFEDAGLDCHQGGIYHPYMTRGCENPDATQRCSTYFQLKDFLIGTAHPGRAHCW